ncbi:DUF4150 domain-containing protein, partial [Yokenella regensburgei]|uniref:PAAR-like domain-containing protein n=2 Tax=Yokenella regensburgei TaxID=158877 RepID=UPI003F15F64F
MAINYISRKDSAWVVISLTPDVCKTPRGDSTPPIPYSVTANMDDSVDTVPSVKANSRPILVLDQSYIPQTKGDKPGTAKGVASRTVGDICEPLQHSTTVKVGGKAVLRHGDTFWMNNRNTTGMIFGQPPAMNVLSGFADAGVKPETPEEKSFLDALFSAFAHEGASRRNATQNMVETRNAWSDAFTDHTNDGTMNSEAIGRMLYASGYYGLSPETARNIAGQIGGEALQTYEAIDTPENRGLMIAVQAIAGAALLSKANGMSGNRDGANVKGKKKKQGDEGEGTCSRYGTCEGDPVNVGTGDFIQQLSVLTLPGSLPLTLSRFYRSRATVGGIFGPKWTDDWSVSLKIVGSNLHFTDHEGVVLYYPVAWDGVFHNAVNSRQANLRLSGKLGETLSLFDRHSRQTRCFSPADQGEYRLCALHDACGNRAEFIHTDGRLTAIQHSDGHTLALGWQDGQLRSIDLVAPQPQRLVTCEYDEHGFLVRCDTFQFSRLWHEYSPEGFMTRWRDTAKTCVDISYDTLGRAIGTLSTAGYYDDRFIYNDEEYCTTYIDAEGGETRYWYDDDGLVTRRLDPLGRESFTVRENTRLISHTDAAGRTTAYDYNDDGDVSRVNLPGGYSLYYDYNDAGQLTRLAAPGNQVWQWAYDERGSMVSLTDPQGRQQQFSYSEQGDLLRQVMPGGAGWQWDYDALHQVRKTIAPDGGVTHTEQDVLGRLLSVQDPLGFTTQFRQSKTHAGPLGSVEEVNRPDGVRELMRHNSEKLPESFTDGEGRTTRYEYGAFDLLTALIRPDGERLECRYDKLTRLTEIINAEGEHYRLEYDKAGQLISETDFTGRTLRYQYDAAGRCIRTTFPDGTHLNRRFNVTDQVTDETVTHGDSDRTLSHTTFRYDSLCRLVEAKNTDATVAYEYNEASRVVAETLNGRRTEYRYDAQQDYVAQRTTAGITEHFSRGLTGELKAWQIADHAPLTVEHDLRGQEIRRASAAGFDQRQGWTQTGMLAEQHSSALHRQYLYDKAYNLTMTADSHRGTMVNSLTANDQINHATWTGSKNVPMREERLTCDQSLNIARRQT